ncbi:hypothetical protein DENSPDRAFT_787308 [Dentipellis sp. KUC8613]|nr:hypothetical protein DENSPDRAFT_787308 [Dentipellis sp. KUC8613]
MLRQHAAQKQPCCENVWCIFKQVVTDSSTTTSTKITGEPWPPKPCPDSRVAQIARDYCMAFDQSNVLEEGCAVCGQLEKLKNMENLRCDI